MKTYEDYGYTEDQVDKYGNPMDGEYLINCCFPDCGCDGARVCMAENGASKDSLNCNVEGMWSGKTMEQRKAVFGLLDLIAKEKPNG